MRKLILAIFGDPQMRRYRGYFPYAAVSAEECAGVTNNPLFEARVDASSPLYRESDVYDNEMEAGRYSGCRVTFMTTRGDVISGTFAADQLREGECR